MKYKIKLDRNDWGQIVDGLNARYEAWTLTADFHGNDGFSHDDNFVPEECASEDEARDIAESYQKIIQAIEIQMEEQRQWR